MEQVDERLQAHHNIGASYESVEQMNQMFKSGSLKGLPEEITVAGVHYHLRDSIHHPFPKMLNEGLKSFVVYSVTGRAKEKPAAAPDMPHNVEFEQAKERGLTDEWVVLIWAMTPSLVVAPARVAMTTQARGRPGVSSGTLREAQQQVIKDEVDIEFSRFRKKVKAKTDTGANMSSFHVDEWRILPGKHRVEFRSHILSDNVLQVDYIDQVVVKTSDSGAEYRPVVSFDISIEGKEIKDAQFNLNDRSGMEDPILIGQNILEKGNFLVDPTAHKDAVRAEEYDINWDVLQERFKDVEAVDMAPALSDDEVKDIYEYLLNTRASLQDVVRHIKTQAYKAIEETVNY